MSLSFRLAIAIIVLTIIAHSGVTAYMFFRADMFGQQAGFPIADQAASIANALSKAPVESEHDILRAVNSPYLIVDRYDQPVKATNPGNWPFGQMMRSMVRRGVSKGFTEGVIKTEFSFLDREEVDQDLSQLHLPVDELVMRLIMTLPDGRQYIIVSDSPFLSLGMISRQFANTLFLALLVVTATLLLLRRIIAPMERFSSAAERLQHDISAPPLDENTGVGEVRDSAKAFNAMQRRIQDLLEERTQMLAAVTHDMRTMVTRWGLRAENLEDPELRERSLREVDELTDMLNQFLSYARSSSQPLTLRKVDLCSLVRSVCDEFAEDEGAISCKTEERVLAETDPAAVKRIVRNLVSNALRYGETAELELKAKESSVIVTVTDAGPGIPEDMLDKVFEPYNRVESSRNRDTGGTGLGLAIVAELSTRLGGKVELKNVPGQCGLEASFHLPLKTMAKES